MLGHADCYSFTTPGSASSATTKLPVPGLTLVTARATVTR